MYDDLGRPPLRPAVLARALAPDGWRVEVVGSVGSTNAVVAERARAGERAGLVVVAEQQTAGRGRLDRQWTSPPRAGLTLSALVRPDGPAADQSWLSLLTGLAVARAVREHAGVATALKWPNDVLVGGRKLCGVLAEVAAPGAVVLGLGLNVSTRADELPEGATSVALAGGTTTDRDTLLRAVLRELTRVLSEPAARDDYRQACSTVGQEVRVELPGRVVRGRAEAVDASGCLVVDGTPYSAGDVVHLRPDGSAGDA